MIDLAGSMTMLISPYSYLCTLYVIHTTEKRYFPFVKYIDKIFKFIFVLFTKYDIY